MVAKPKDVDEYIDSFPDNAARLLRELRALSQRAAPDTTEELKWGNPAYLLDGTIMFIYSGHKEHANFVFTPSTRESFDDELTDFRTGKGSIQLPYGEPVPTALLERMIKHRLEEFERDGVLWMS